MSIMPEGSRGQDAMHGASCHGTRVAVSQTLVTVAERELERALVEQVRPSMGMYVHPSRAEDAAFDRAVREICNEAHRLDLPAETLLVGIKQAWSHLAATRARHLGDRDGDVLREVVSNSIEVFFDSRTRDRGD
jgi:hypothetical protein